jgi:hypothetical protein
MRRSRVLLLAIGGILLPVALAFAGYLIVSGLGASADSVPLPVRATPAATSSPSPTASADNHGGNRGKATPDETPTAGPVGASPTGDGRCSEPEHRNDPSCSQSGDSSGPGSGGSGGGSSDDGSGGSGSSGHGSDSGRSPTASPSGGDSGGGSDDGSDDHGGH